MEEKNIINIIKDEIPSIKILLMGKTGVGKTAMKSIIFHNNLAKDTLELAYTNEIEESHLRFMKILSLYLLDCCSKEDYIKQYFDSKKEKIFSKVAILIFVAELQNNIIRKNSHDNLDDIIYFEK